MLFLITTMGIGGAEAQVSRVSQGLATDGWVVRILTLRDTPLGSIRTDTGRVNVDSLGVSGSLWALQAVRGLIAQVRRFRPDLLVTFLLQANVIGRVVGRSLGVPVVSSVRNTRFGGSSRVGAALGDWLEWLTAPAAVVTVVNSERSAEALVRRRVIGAQRLRVVPNMLVHRGFEVSRSDRAMVRDELGLGSDAFAWLVAGRLEVQKNHVALVRAFAQLRSEFAAARLVVAGDGALRSNLEHLTESLGIRSSVRFTGVRSDLPRVMAAADAFILPSRWEGMPNVVIESMAQGLPTVATPVGGVPELIEDEVTGWITASPEVEDLCATMRVVMKSPPATLGRVGAAAQTVVATRHASEAVLDAWRRVLLDAVMSSGGRHA